MYVFLLVFAALAPTVLFAAPRTFKELTDTWINIINGGIGVMLTLGIVFYFYGIISSFASSKGGFTKEYRNQLVWGMIALFIMFSVWGILALLRNTLFGGGGGSFGGSKNNEVICKSLEDCVIAE